MFRYNHLRDEVEDEQDNDETTREQLYRYFNGKDQRRVDTHYPEDINRQMEDPTTLQLADIQGEVIKYHGKQGYFIPLQVNKKLVTYLSPSKMVYESNDSQAGPSEEAMFERLYRLARALNGKQQYEESLEYYKK